MAPHLGFIKCTALKSLWSYFNRGPYPAPGDIFTLNVSMLMMGQDYKTWLIPSMRMIVDFSQADPMLAVNSSGQSDNPSSPHYDDGIKAWRDGKYFSFPFRDCVAITLYFFVEKRGLLKLSIMNFFKILGVKPFPKTSLFSLFSNCDTVSQGGGNQCPV